MYKYVKKNKFVRGYMEAIAFQTSAPTVHWVDNISCIYILESKIVTPRVKNIDIPVYFLQEQCDNGSFIPKYYKYSVMLSYMCTKPCSVKIIIHSTKLVTGFRLYPTSDTEHYQLMILHDFFVK